jgi:hypothetical protein
MAGLFYNTMIMCNTCNLTIICASRKGNKKGLSLRKGRPLLTYEKHLFKSLYLEGNNSLMISERKITMNFPFFY